MTNDGKIQDIALRYIRRAIGDRAVYSFESLGTLHSALSQHQLLSDGELVLVSSFFSDESWYVFTTRRIVSRFNGVQESLEPSHNIRGDFPNFKGYDPVEGDDGRAGAIPRDAATITDLGSGAIVRFEYQTFHGSSLPMHAVLYWQVKHPFLHKLMTNAERAAYASRNG